MRTLPPLLALALLAGCSGGQQATGPQEPVPVSPAAAAVPESTAATPDVPPEGSPMCRPIVSGCGCAYQCARSVEALGGGRHRVVHDFQDSRLDEAIEQRWCFDTAGHAYPEQGAPAEATRCLDVFFDNTPCGGECIPTTGYLDCRAEGDHCAHGPGATGAAGDVATGTS